MLENGLPTSFRVSSSTSIIQAVLEEVQSWVLELVLDVVPSLLFGSTLLCHLLLTQLSDFQLFALKKLNRSFPHQNVPSHHP